MSDQKSTSHLQRGKQAEILASTFLAKQGLSIIARNVRCRYGEIDLVARDGEVLVFVEVRLRASNAFGGAVESITLGKQRRLLAAAQYYLSTQAAVIGGEPPCRFDAVLLAGLDAGELTWQRDILQASR